MLPFSCQGTYRRSGNERKTSESCAGAGDTERNVDRRKAMTSRDTVLMSNSRLLGHMADLRKARGYQFKDCFMILPDMRVHPSRHWLAYATRGPSPGVLGHAARRLLPTRDSLERVRYPKSIFEPTKGLVSANRSFFDALASQRCRGPASHHVVVGSRSAGVGVGVAGGEPRQTLLHRRRVSQATPTMGRAKPVLRAASSGRDSATEDAP